MVRSARGVTLVELMISLLLGSVLVGAMLSLLTTQRTLANQISATAALSERVAFAAAFFQRHLMEAGYAPVASTAPAPVSFTGKRASVDDTWGDTLVIRSEGGRGCTDDELENNAGTEWRKFSLHREGDKRELRCEDSEGGPYPMLDGVEAMQVQYGIDTNLDRVPDFYSNAGTVTGKPGRVVSLRVGLLMCSDNPIFERNNVAVPSRFLLDSTLKSSHKNGADFGDGRLRRTLVVTVALRNLDS